MFSKNLHYAIGEIAERDGNKSLGTLHCTLGGDANGNENESLSLKKMV